ncbi:MAG: sensor histidine kinase [Nitrososphaerales archaeon]
MSSVDTGLLRSESDHATLLEFMKGAEKSLDIVLPSEVALSLLEKWEIFDNLSMMRSTRAVAIQIVCIFSEKTQRTIRVFSPFIQFRLLDPNMEKSTQVTMIRDGVEVLLLDSAASGALESMESRPVRLRSGQDEQGGSGKEEGLEIFARRLIETFNLSSSPLLVKSWIAVFRGLWQQREQYDALLSEKAYTDFLLDLLSHDIGNYHQIILLSLQLAREDIAAEIGDLKNTPRDRRAAVRDNLGENNKYEQLADILGKAEDALRQSSQLVNNIKKLGKLQRQKEVRLWTKDLISSIEDARQILNDILGGTMRNQTTERKKRLELRLFFPDDDLFASTKGRPSVLGDDLLPEIFVNLFSNAIRYTDSETVKIDLSIEKRRIRITPFWEVSVTDYGRGIPEDVKSTLFQRYSRHAKGTGLGLSIVNAIVKRYEGKLWVENRVFRDYSKGTTFGMLLKSSVTT